MFDSVWNFLISDAVLTKPQLRRLGEHKYKSKNISILERFLKPFWYELAQRYPHWLAPNVLTLTGLLMSLCGGVVFAYYSPDAKSEPPRWVYFFCIFTLLLYQTLDGTDGMQARRTRSYSPLGELFDHGCDALSLVFVTLQVISCWQLGEHPDLVLFLFLLSMAMFYIAHWQIYVTGCMEFQRFDATEGETLIVGLLFATGCYGPGIWSIELFRIPLKYYFLSSCVAIVLHNVFCYMRSIFTGGVGKEGSTVADTSIIYPVFPLFAFLLPPVWIYRMSSSTVFHEHIVLFCMGCGMISAKITMKIIVAAMSRSALTLWDTILWGPTIVIANYYLDIPMHEYASLYFLLVYGVINVFCYCWAMANQLCGSLGIRCFRIPYGEENIPNPN